MQDLHSGYAAVSLLKHPVLRYILGIANEGECYA